MICHSCERETEGVCTSCEKPVCDKCSVPYTLHNPVDYDLCTNCGDDCDEWRAEEYFKELKEDEERHKMVSLELAKTPQQREKEKVIINHLFEAIKRNLND